MDTLINKLNELNRRYQILERQMADQKVINDHRRFSEVTKEAAGLEPIVKLTKDINQTKSAIAETKELLNDAKDQSMIRLVRDELQELENRLTQALTKAKQAIHELENPGNKSLQQGNAILEVRGAAGGDEAKIWARELLRMYSRYAEAKGWQVQLIDEGVIKISGRDVYGRLQHEAGVHRVQRVPITESQGRLHTSTATVAVLPEVAAAKIEINPDDLEFETFRSGGPGGQNVNKVNTAVRIRHLPSGITVVCTSERSQHQNRRLALEILRAKLWQEAKVKQQQAVSNLRRTAVGRGMRAEKIRTYNFPQNRVTDHRLGKSWHQLETILDGDLEPVISALNQAG